MIHHGVMGALDPSGVYNHQDAIDHPWKWALIHGGFVWPRARVARDRLAAQRERQGRGRGHRRTESEERFRGAFEGAPIGMVLFSFGTSDGGGVTQVNEALCADHRPHGRAPDGDRPCADVVHPEDTHGRRRGDVEQLTPRRGEAPAVRAALHPRRRAHGLGVGRACRCCAPSRPSPATRSPRCRTSPSAGAPPRSWPTRRCTTRSRASATAAPAGRPPGPPRPRHRRAPAAAPALRPRRLQDLQRHVRPPRRRRAADPDGHAPADRAGGPRLRLPHGRRRVLRAEPARVRRPRGDRRQGDRGADRARRGLPRDRLLRLGHAARRGHDRDRGAARGRPPDVRAQEPRQPQLGRAPERRRAAAASSPSATRTWASTSTR